MFARYGSSRYSRFNKKGYFTSSKIVKELIKRGANVHANNDEALEYACELGYFDLVKYLVEEAGANIFAEGRKSWQEASFSGHDHIVEYLDERERLLKSQK